MKKLIVLAALFASFFANAQTHVAGKWRYGWLGSDSIFFIPGDTLANAPLNSVAVKNGIMYVKGTLWVSIGGSGGPFYDSTLMASRYKVKSDSITLAAAINTKQSSLSFPNATHRYLNGYNNFPTLSTDSVFEDAGHLYYHDANARAALSMTNIGTSGISSYDPSTGIFNIPQFQSALNVTAAHLLGRFSGSSGIVQELSLGSHFTLNQTTGLLDVNATIPEGIVGKLYGSGNWSNLNQFTDHGPAGVTASGGKIVFSGGTSDFVRSLDLDSLIGRNGFTDLKNLSIYVRVITGTKSSTSKFGVGIRSQVSALTSDALAQFDATNNSSSGTINFCALTTSVTDIVSTSASSVSFTPGDKIGLTFKINGKIVTLYARNETTSSNTVSLSWSYTFNVGDLPAYPNMGKISIFNTGGASDGFSVDSLSVYSSAVTFPSIVFVTDSKGSLYSGDISLSYPELLHSIYGSTVYSGGSSESATDAFARLPEFLNTIHPRAVVISVGRNAGSTDTLTAYKPLVDSLIAHGIQVYHLIEGADATWTGGPQFVAFINGHYAPNTIMDGYTMVANHPEYLASDLVHYSVLGHQAFANLVLSANLLQKGTYTDGLIGQGLPGQVPYWVSSRGFTGDTSMNYDSNICTFSVHKNRNGYTRIIVGNNSSGSGAVASIGTLPNDVGNLWEIDNTSSNGGTYGEFSANMLGIYSTHPKVVIMVDRPSSSFNVAVGVGGVTSAFTVKDTRQVGMGLTANAPDASAALDITSITRGLLIPRMTTTQRNAISAPATGLEIFNTTTGQFEYYNGSAWVAIGSSLSLGAVGSSPNVNGLTYSGGVLNGQPANASNAGFMPAYMFAHLDSMIRGLTSDTITVSNIGHGLYIANSNGGRTLLFNTIWGGSNITLSKASDSTNIASLRGNVTIDTSITTPRLLGNGTPTIAAGAGAGSGPSVSISGTGLSGRITVSAGATPTINGVICTVTMPVTMSNTNYNVIFSPSTVSAGALLGTVFMLPASTSTFTLNSGATALTATGVYSWDYIVVAR